jgi:hypothetical protein
VCDFVPTSHGAFIGSLPPEIILQKELTEIDHNDPYIDEFNKLENSLVTEGSRDAKEKRPDTVGQPSSAEIGALNMPSLKAKKLGKLPRKKYS